jgi:hypothetical protein
VFGIAATIVLTFLWLQDPTPNNLILIGIKALIVVLAMLDPFYPCLLFVIFSHFRVHEAFPILFEMRIPQFLAIATLGSLIWHLLFVKSVKPFWSSELALLAIFFGIASFGVVFAIDRPAAIEYWTGSFVKITIMAVAIAWTTRTPSNFLTAARAFIFAGIAVALVALYNKTEGVWDCSIGCSGLPAAASCSWGSSRHKAAVLCWECWPSCLSSGRRGSAPRPCSSQGSSQSDWRCSPLRRSRIVKSVAAIRVSTSRRKVV